MPRYSAVIRSSNDRALKRARYIWAPTPSEAADQCVDWLLLVRRTQHRMRSLDLWSIATRLSPHHMPKVILSGHIPAGE